MLWIWVSACLLHSDHAPFFTWKLLKVLRTFKRSKKTFFKTHYFAFRIHQKFWTKSVKTRIVLWWKGIFNAQCVNLLIIRQWIISNIFTFVRRLYLIVVLTAITHNLSSLPSLLAKPRNILDCLSFFTNSIGSAKLILVFNYGDVIGGYFLSKGHAWSFKVVHWFWISWAQFHFLSEFKIY